jgi:hypothetical protein
LVNPKPLHSLTQPFNLLNWGLDAYPVDHLLSAWRNKKMDSGMGCLRNANKKPPKEKQILQGLGHGDFDGFEALHSHISFLRG